MHSCVAAMRHATLVLSTCACVQDDMQLSPDFFSYFEATAPLLDADPSLFCVSSWNDHGQVPAPPPVAVACCGSYVGAGAATCIPGCLPAFGCLIPPPRPAAGPLCQQCHAAVPLRLLPRPRLDAQSPGVGIDTESLVSAFCMLHALAASRSMNCKVKLDACPAAVLQAARVLG